MPPRYRSDSEASPARSQDGFQYSGARFSTECLWQDSLRTNVRLRHKVRRGPMTKVNFSARDFIAIYNLFEHGGRHSPPPIAAGHDCFAEIAQQEVTKGGEALLNAGNCLLCALRNKAARSPLGSLRGIAETWAIGVCYEHGRLLERQDRRGQAIASLRANIEILAADDDEALDTRAWLRMAWRGVGYWVLSDADLSRLGVSFFHILDASARPSG